MTMRLYERQAHSFLSNRLELRVIATYRFLASWSAPPASPYVLAVVPLKSNGRDVLKGAQAPAGVTRRWEAETSLRRPNFSDNANFLRPIFFGGGPKRGFRSK